MSGTELTELLWIMDDINTSTFLVKILFVVYYSDFIMNELVELYASNTFHAVPFQILEILYIYIYILEDHQICSAIAKPYANIKTILYIYIYIYSILDIINLATKIF